MYGLPLIFHALFRSFIKHELFDLKSSDIHHIKGFSLFILIRSTFYKPEQTVFEEKKKGVTFIPGKERGRKLAMTQEINMLIVMILWSLLGEAIHTKPEPIFRIFSYSFLIASCSQSYHENRFKVISLKML